MPGKMALGLDFGSLSGRALLVDLDGGETIATATCSYRQGFIETVLPASGERLPPDWTLQDPQDYLDVLRQVVPEVLARGQVAAADVIGVGVAFTASTVLPILQDGTPLCFLSEFRDHKHAYVKKWKHHAAQDKANRINELATERQEPFLDRYGGKTSAEWLFPKLWQILDEAPDVFAAMDRLIEASDWIVMMLTGHERRNSCAAGYKALWHKQTGYPDDHFLRTLDPRLADSVDTKLSRKVYPTGSKAGGITTKAAEWTGLLPGTAVAVGHVDAHVAVPAAGITDAGHLLMIMGTSNCHLLLGREAVAVEGICGVVEDGILPGLFGYEAGQPCVGDLLDWFVQQAVPPDIHQKARERGQSVHQVLRERAQRQKPGEHGLLALDWWNGNRSVLVDGDLSGLLLGLSLATRPEDQYRALMEATAYGSRLIIEQFTAAGLPVDQVYACGGIAHKDPLMMQIYADVTRRSIRVVDCEQTVALGAALYGAVAAGPEKGGFADIFEAARTVPRPPALVYQPHMAHSDLYDQLYGEYCLLHDTFGRGSCDVMKRLRAIRAAARQY